LGVAFVILKYYRDDAGAGLEGRVAEATKLLKALDVEDHSVDDLIVVLFPV